MCYPKPGPRCSGHARRILERAQLTYQTDTNYDNYSKMRVAEEEFLLTPQGHKTLEKKIEDSSNHSEKYELMRQLEHYKEVRALRIAEVSNADKGDVNTEHEDGLPPGVTYSEEYGYVKDGKPCDPMAENGLQTYFSPTPYTLETESDYYGCSGQCSDDYMCRCATYEGLRVAPITDDAYIKGSFGLSDDFEVPQAWRNKLQNIGGVMNNVEAVATRGYYGEEAHIECSGALKKTMSEIFQSMPNSQDREGVYGYLRESGIPNDGRPPLSALKQKMHRKVRDAATAKKVRDATTVKSMDTINLDNVNTGSIRKPSENNPYSFPARNPSGKSKPHAGVLVKNGAGNYTLVDGAERFEAAKASGAKRWKFLVLG